jgi:hypothetical protein
MALAPVVLMAAIGIHARTYVDPFEWPNTRPDQARMNAYLPLVVETSDRLRSKDRALESDARYLATVWIDGARTGKLKPLIPVSADELVSTNHKSKIFDSNGFVCRRLVEFADGHIKAGEYKEAAINLTLASDSLRALKYSSFMHLFRASLLQSNIIRRIGTIYPHLDKATRTRVAAGMNRMKGDRREFEAIARQARMVIRQQLYASADTENVVQLASRMAPESSFFEQPALAKGLPVDNMPSPEENAFMFPNQKIEANQCVETDERNRLMIKKIMSLQKSVGGR